jgi:hypothetical protein
MVLKDSFDLETAAGRLMAHVLASVASYETEVPQRPLESDSPKDRYDLALASSGT